jgi:hypothetical protein
MKTFKKFSEDLNENKNINIKRDPKFRKEHGELLKDGYRLKTIEKNSKGGYESVYFHKDGATPNIRIKHKSGKDNIHTMDKNVNESFDDYDEMVITPHNVKFDGNKVSYDLKAEVSTARKGNYTVNDKKFISSVIKTLGDKQIKKDLVASPEAAIIAMEVEFDEKGQYIEIGGKKLYFKGK